jgi:hypothetical protein
MLMVFGDGPFGRQLKSDENMWVGPHDGISGFIRRGSDLSWSVPVLLLGDTLCHVMLQDGPHQIPAP